MFTALCNTSNKNIACLYIAVFDSVGAFPRWRGLAQGPTENNIEDPKEREELKLLISGMLKELPPR